MKIQYNRDTGAVVVEGGSSISSWLAPLTPPKDLVAMAEPLRQ
jgi:hypothetical protein